VSQQHTEWIVVPGKELPGGLAAAFNLLSQTERLERLAADMEEADRVESVTQDELRNICLH